MSTDEVYIDAFRTGLETDAVFELLSNRRRRAVLYVLYRADATATLSELVEEVALIDRDGDAGAVSDDERTRVYVSLYQTHLPKLDAHGLVEFDDDARTVALSRAAREATVPREAVRRGRWDRYYALLLLVGVAASTAVSGLEWLEAWSMVSLVTLSGLTLVLVAHVRSPAPRNAGSYIRLDDLV